MDREDTPAKRGLIAGIAVITRHRVSGKARNRPNPRQNGMRCASPCAVAIRVHQRKSAV